MISFIDAHRPVLGVEPICRLLPIAPSTYYEVVAKRTDVDRLSARARRDMAMKVEIRRVFNENFQVYGVRKVWRQLQREGHDIARCTVARLMRMMGLQGIIRGKPVKTSVSDKAAPCPLDRVNRQFRAPAPNMLWLSDFTYVATWQGFVYVAFVIDAFARRIVGWRASRTAQAGFVLDALDQALHDRRPVHRGGLIHHSDSRDEWLGLMLDRETALRSDKRLTNRLAASKLRFPDACIENIDFAAHRGLDRRNTLSLAQGAWLSAQTSVPDGAISWRRPSMLKSVTFFPPQVSVSLRWTSSSRLRSGTGLSSTQGRLRRP